MLNTKVFGEELKRYGFDFFTGVPCSFLKPLINYAINSGAYVASVNEGDAVTIAGGAYIGGRKSIVLMQNSGLTNAISPLTSFNYTFRLPVLGFVSLRGEPGLKDEPQHELMGQITTNMLDLIKVKWEYLSQDIETAKTQLFCANNIIAANVPFFFVVKKGTFAEEELNTQGIKNSQRKLIIKKSSADQLPIRLSALQIINKLKDNNTLQLATTGKTGRELYETEDASNNLYMVGSMGCISSLGLGLAITRKDKDIVVIDGDGSLLMRMGSLATNGYYQPENMIHILLDNGSHDSTGGRATVSGNVDFIEIAGACGYSRSVYVHNLDELHEHIRAWKKEKGLTFLYMKIAKGSSEQLGRPSVKPFQVKERLLEFVNANGNKVDKWKEIWNKRTIPDGEAVLDRLIQADGFDSGAGKISADSWKKYAGFIAERLGIKPGDSLFELGSGSGAFLYLFYEAGHKVGGIDYSDSLIKIAGEVMSNMDFEVCEAINIKTEEKYDFVISNSVFHYFPDIHYAEAVINRMLEKSNKGVAILEVPDLALKEESEKARRGALSPGEYEEKYKGLNHLYYDKDWFYVTGKKHNCTVEIFDQDIEDYGNNAFRFNVLMIKNG